MSFAQDNGYTPATFDDIMDAVRLGINLQFGTSFTVENFVGTNWYKYFYALVQKVIENETKTSEIFLRLQEYIATTNARIQRPSVSLPGLIDSFESEGYVASVKRMIEADAGQVSICINTDSDAVDYAATKLALCELIRDYVCAGVITNGTETESLVLSNGQSFDFSFFLPDPTPVILRLGLTVSENQVAVIPTDEEIRLAVFDNINARYRLGWDFEPQRYFTAEDASWAATILLEWSSDAGGSWHSTVFAAAFDDLFTFSLGDIAVTVA